jgi:hemerythrin-like domain-containing protein/mannose-6-phosphate isomerase-like protein (cupin superfamily)
MSHPETTRQASYKTEVCQSLIREHRHMETLLQDLDVALQRLKPDLPESLNAVRKEMARISPEMNTHFACEERALFPAVSPYHPMVLMEAEHEELITLRNALSTLLAQCPDSTGHVGQAREVGARFISEMLDHIGREDHGIFPTCERALSETEKQAVIAEMEKIRAEAAQAPTPDISRPSPTLAVFQPDFSPTDRPIFSRNLLRNPDIELKHLTIKAGEELAAHWSPKQITLICLQGEGLLSANQEEVPLVPGTCAVMSPRLQHGVRARQDLHLLLVLH